MLTDIFAYRYQKYRIWTEYTEVEQRLLNQAFGIVKEIFPYYDSKGNEEESKKRKWKSLHDQLAHELGIDELSARYYSYTQKDAIGQDVQTSGWWHWIQVCEKFIKALPRTQHSNSDRFIKERISFIEIAFRQREREIKLLKQSLAAGLPGVAQTELAKGSVALSFLTSATEGAKELGSIQINRFALQVTELNERFRRAGAPLTYHNGFIQISLDNLIEKNLAEPFWKLVSNPLWKNVDIDMKESLDRRDANDKDPALFAAKALESTIKIISDKKGWSRGKESGASTYIDNLQSKENGNFISAWEADMLRDYFRKVRNPLGHGPGSAPMPVLTTPQTDWAIESAMSWIRTLVRRM